MYFKKGIVGRLIAKSVLHPKDHKFWPAAQSTHIDKHKSLVVTSHHHVRIYFMNSCPKIRKKFFDIKNTPLSVFTR